MKRFLSRFSKRQFICFGIGFVSFCLFLGLTIYSNGKINSLGDQQIVSRWSEDGGYAQISCFFEAESYVDPLTLETFSHELDSILEQESITAPSEGARLWLDSYSAKGSVTVTAATTKRTSMNLQAIGVEGDFFLFHPLKLVNGGYFNTDSLMKDYVIIDEEAAWQLFGSNDVAGMQVVIQGVAHTIVGVIDRDDSKLAKAGGLTDSTIYMSYESLSEYGDCGEISEYEVLMPNPIDKFALSKVKEKLGVTAEQTEYIENSNRFSMLSLIQILGNFDERSMQAQAIIYPYWENIARAVENQIAVLFLFRVFFLLIPIVLIVIQVVILWKHRKWNKNDVKEWLTDAMSFLGRKIKALCKHMVHKKLKEEDNYEIELEKED